METEREEQTLMTLRTYVGGMVLNCTWRLQFGQ